MMMMLSYMRLERRCETEKNHNNDTKFCLHEFVDVEIRNSGDDDTVKNEEIINMEKINKNEEETNSDEDEKVPRCKLYYFDYNESGKFKDADDSEEECPIKVKATRPQYDGFMYLTHGIWEHYLIVRSS